MIKGAIFDVDGTILDSMAIWEEAGERYLRSIKVEAEPGLSKALAEMTVEEAAFYMKKMYHLPQREGEIVRIRTFKNRNSSFKATRTKQVGGAFAPCQEDKNRWQNSL